MRTTTILAGLSIGVGVIAPATVACAQTKTTVGDRSYAYTFPYDDLPPPPAPPLRSPLPWPCLLHRPRTSFFTELISTVERM